MFMVPLSYLGHDNLLNVSTLYTPASTEPWVADSYFDIYDIVVVQRVYAS